MQNSCHKLIKEHWSIAIIIVLVPLLMWAVIPILPTHDDWASTTKPDFTPFFTKEHFFFYGYHWRPFDTWIGYIVGRNPQVLWPAFNHILVVIGHALNVMLIYRFILTLGFSRMACNIAALFFFFTPAAMATVLAVDSQNQTYAMLWGLLSFLAYIKLKRSKYMVWLILLFIAALSKENGLMWALITPILAFGFNFINQQSFRKDLLIGIVLMIAYALAIVVLPKEIIIHPDYVPDDLKVFKNIAKFLLTTFVTVDYIYLLHGPSRNLPIAAFSLLMAAPFLYMVFGSHIERYKEKKLLCSIVCLLIAIGPHILTVFSMMHTYAALAIVSIFVAHGTDCCRQWQNGRLLISAFILFLATAIFIDAHLCHASYKSGLVGKKMAQEAIEKTGEPVKRVYVIIVEDDYPKLSSFCVIPNEAFGWGWASQYETNYQWPEIIKDTTIERSSVAMKNAHQMARKIIDNKTYDCVWIVNHKDIDVVKR